MALVHQQVGNALAQWDTDSPLKWSMEETTGQGNNRRTNQYDFDLRPLESGYQTDFLMALRDSLIARRHQVALRTIETECRNLRSLLLTCHEAEIMSGKVVQIDSAFLLGLGTVANKISGVSLAALARFFSINRFNTALFCPTLHPEDFPKPLSKRGSNGQRIDAIVAKALSRASLVAVLDAIETAFEAGEIDIGRYSFAKLALNIFCRPESYRQIRLADLRLDRDPQTGEIHSFLDIFPAKTGLHAPQKITYRLHRDVGQLLALQREAVIDKFGHLVPSHERSKLALFPAIRLSTNGTWISTWSAAHQGMLKNSAWLAGTYLRPINALTRKNLNFNVLRHTIGTQLAQTGCSAHTIAAVLKHANDSTCQNYVDIVFHGLIDKLSDALEPAFAEHFPVFAEFASTHDPLPRERAVVSTDPETGHSETTALCGRRTICQYAPLACYACPRFIPCWDADHSINLKVVEQEIRLFEGQGLPMQHEVRKYKHLRNCIRVVTAACDMKRRAMELEEVARWAT